MLRKLFWSVILFVILFILSVFKAPDLAQSIADLAGFPNLPTKIVQAKEKYDQVVTNMPTKEEIENQYNLTISWAIEIKENITNWVQTTKDKVDSLRETMSGAEEKLNELKETYNDAKDFLDETSQKIDQAKQLIEDTQAVIDNVQNSWETNTN